jgi:hypothetical protein
MEENKDLVTEQVTENVEQTTEQTPKTYTEAEFNAKLDEVLGKKIARREAKIRKEYDRKYGDLVETLKAGTGKESVEEMTTTFADFYRQKGIELPQKPNYTARDIEVLAQAEANDIISAGFDEVVDEVDRLASVGAENMTPREKAVFKVLAEHRQRTERSRELDKIGVTQDVYNSQEFKEFASKFNSNTPITDVYDIYAKTKPKKDIQPMGSMKNSESGEKGVKEFYSVEEAKKFSRKELDANPELFKAIERSMLKW